MLIHFVVSLGKWILRYLFANLIDEEIKRDEAYRHKLNEDLESRQAAGSTNAPTSITIPQSPASSWANTDRVVTPKATGHQWPINTPGFGIGQATPSVASGLPGVPEGAVASPVSPLERKMSFISRPSTDHQDYFSSAIGPVDGAKPPVAPSTPAAESADAKTSTDGGNDRATDKGTETQKSDNGKSPSTPFGKKFRMSFSTKKLGRSASQATQEKPAIVDEKAEESESSSNHEKEVDDNFHGVIQKIRQDYDRQLLEAPDKYIETRVTPSLASDTPVLKLPPGTKVVLQEETSGGSANIYQGTVRDVGKDVDLIEQKAPMWLGDVLLQNQIPFKDPVKVSFVLHPMDNALPAVSTSDGNNRLNANRMLRVRKILAYIAERIEPQPEEPDPTAMKPEEYLELYCNDQVCHIIFSFSYPITSPV